MNNINNTLHQLVVKWVHNYAMRVYALLLLTTLTACVDREDFSAIDDVPDGMVRVYIKANIENTSTVITRTAPTTADKALQPGNIYVLVFNGTDDDATLMQKPALATFSADKLDVVLNQQTINCYLCVVANVSTTEKNYLGAIDAGVKLSQIRSNLKYNMPASLEIKHPLPVSGWADSPTQLVKGGSSPTPLMINVPLIRSVARIDIDGSTPNFIITNVTVANGARYGYTLPQPQLPMFGATDMVPYKAIPNSSLINTMTDLLFCFENGGSTGANSRATRVVIYGKPTSSSSPSYYPIDIIYTDNGKTVTDIERNKCYKIVLNLVDKDGYRSLDDALRSEAFNNQLNVEIVVTDPYAHDITTNGKQFLGVTNGEFVLYPSANASGVTPAVNNVHIASFSYTCDPGWSAGTIECIDQNGNKGALLKLSSGITERMDVNNSTTVRDIMVDIDATFKSGMVILHIGNLRKEIMVRRMPPTLATGGVYSDYFVAPNTKTDFKVGEIISPSASTSWLKVSKYSYGGAGGSSLNDKEINHQGGIYIHAEGNLNFDNSANDREAFLYIAADKDDQRIKVLVQQSTFNVYNVPTVIKPFSYVGTFHRWNQTGERLIRIYAKQDASGNQILDGNLWWQADVVAGRDFIILDTEPSPDTGIKTVNNAYGVGDNPIYNTDALIESNCQLNSTLRSVRGTNTYVYFRVGMTSKLSSAEATPRYGLIIISWGDNSGKILGQHPIYVRQGEAADYLMRPWDPVTTNPENVTNPKFPMRASAVKFSPYNLADPDKKPFGMTADYLTVQPRGAVFIDYPSQAGLYFPALRTTAGDIIAYRSDSQYDFVLSTNLKDDSSWNSDTESCPVGYRRLNDGDNKITHSTGNIIGSELRQSLLLFPTHGESAALETNQQNFTNQYRGYLADGYFDRRPIVTSVNRHYGATENGPALSCVTPNTVNEAFSGTLFYNPNNNASIFIPNAGTYGRGAGISGFYRKGSFGSFWTSTPQSSGQYWCMWMGNGFGGTGAGDITSAYATTVHFGFPIRCVKDEQTTVNSGDKPGSSTGQTDIEDIIPGTSSQLAIRYQYNNGSTGTLQTQLEALYDASQRKRINSIAISGNRKLDNADYAYLNAWANRSSSINGIDYSGSILHHLIIRGTGNTTIPANAFVSSQWYNIILMDAKVIEDNAFASNIVSGTLPYSVTGMRNLTLGNLDAITIGTNAFPFSTNLVQIHLAKLGVEYAGANVSSLTWKGRQWNAIKGE